MDGSADKATAVLVDDYPAVLHAVSGILQSVCKIVATVSDPRKAAATASVCDPDIVVLDIGMPGISGFEIVRQLRRARLRAKILFLTIVEDADYQYAAQRLAISFVIKRRMHIDLITAVQETLAGRQFFSPLNPEEVQRL